MIGLLWIAVKNQWFAQMKRPVEFFSSVVAIILNNSFYLYGIYMLAFLSMSEDPYAIREYLVSTGMVLTAWGCLNVLGGGLYQLGSLIETGELETFLSKPRYSLLLVAISKSNLVSLGDLIQGVATLGLVAVLYGVALGLGAMLSSVILIVAFASVVILLGSFSFFSTRGSSLSYVLLNITLTLSLFPVGRALKGRERWILYFTPLLMTATLPRMASLVGTPGLFMMSFLATCGLFGLSVLVFDCGLRRYKSKNYIFLNE